MQTIKAPAVADTQPAYEWTTPTATFTPFAVTCHTRQCGAELLVDDPADLTYRADIVFYAEDVTYRLYVTCPHCAHFINLEQYGAPGNPARRDCYPYRPTPTYRCVPTWVRSRAYKKWEASRDAAYWQMFFSMRDIRYWAKDNPRAARKLHKRLLPA